MPSYFLDASAAVKLYVSETGTDWLRSLRGPLYLWSEDEGNNELVIARITAVEVAAALYRRVHGGTLAAEEAEEARDELAQDLERTFRVIEIDEQILQTALGLAESRGLRGYDCVQLAAALLTRQARSDAGLSDLILLTADKELMAAAVVEGIKVEDPNQH